MQNQETCSVAARRYMLLVTREQAEPSRVQSGNEVLSNQDSVTVGVIPCLLIHHPDPHLPSSRLGMALD